LQQQVVEQELTTVQQDNLVTPLEEVEVEFMVFQAEVEDLKEIQEELEAEMLQVEVEAETQAVEMDQVQQEEPGVMV
jgi:transcriptional antiterminator Rof (Rho-off)